MKKVFVFLLSLMTVVGILAGPAMGGQDITLTVVYDNYVSTKGVRSDWGFSCLIEGPDRTILFDTGARGDILLSNMETLGIDPASVDVIVLSHIHHDHIGGIDAFLSERSDIPVYFGDSFPASFDRHISDRGARPVRVRKPVEICPHVLSTGEISGHPVAEQGLILDTDEGSIIITGCSHPGIVTILHRAREICDRDVSLVCGGFHLTGVSENAVRQIIASFKKMGVQRCGPTHCTGDRAITLFKKAYGNACIPMGVGRVIRISQGREDTAN